MKFLTIGNYKDIYYTMPQAEREKLSVSTLEVDVDIKKKMGDKFLFYTVPGRDRMLVIISEFGSIEELAKEFNRVPSVTAGFFKYETYPLMEIDETQLKAMLSKVKAGK